MTNSPRILRRPADDVQWNAERMSCYYSEYSNHRFGCCDVFSVPEIVRNVTRNVLVAPIWPLRAGQRHEEAGLTALPRTLVQADALRDFHVVVPGIYSPEPHFHLSILRN